MHPGKISAAGIAFLPQKQGRIFKMSVPLDAFDITDPCLTVR
jgi:hypothetical protein